MSDKAKAGGPSQEAKAAPWKEPFDIRPLRRHSDPRGSLFEILRFKDQGVPGQGQLYTFSIEPGLRRGDHYHLRKQEWFTCVHGKATIFLTTKDGSTTSVELSAADPKIIYAGPGTAHGLLNETGEAAIIVSYGSEQHDPTDEDTFKRMPSDTLQKG